MISFIKSTSSSVKSKEPLNDKNVFAIFFLYLGNFEGNFGQLFLKYEL